MAKSNLKTLNNNFVTQFTPCSMYSKYSYIYFTYIYLSFLFFSLCFFTECPAIIYKTYMYKQLNNLNSIYSNYTNFFIKYTFYNRFFKQAYNISYKLMSYNGSIMNVFDFIFFRTNNKSFRKIIKKNNIKLYNYKILSNLFLSTILK